MEIAGVVNLKEDEGDYEDDGCLCIVYCYLSICVKARNPKR